MGKGLFVLKPQQVRTELADFQEPLLMQLHHVFFTKLNQKILSLSHFYQIFTLDEYDRLAQRWNGGTFRWH